MPGWAWQGVWLISVLAGVSALALRGYNRRLKAIAKRRPNLTRGEFIAQLVPDVSLEAAEFLWKTALDYIEPHATPHPDDHLWQDLPIDPDDIHLDWPRQWAESRGFHESQLPDWPEGTSPTIRNFGRWLDMAKAR